jgi:hypothetical protein
LLVLIQSLLPVQLLLERLFELLDVLLGFFLPPLINFAAHA